MPSSRAHSAHNEQLCDLLWANGNFNDWVVTTAFYSAIHLVDHQIFPLTISVEPVFANFKQYLNRKSPLEPPHRVRRDLVEKYLPSCIEPFDWLLNACHGARYNSYEVSKPIAEQARKKLDAIKKHSSKA